ncbi:MAG: hypothetical protein ACYDCL_18435 [Myxococcales bacterium]
MAAGGCFTVTTQRGCQCTCASNVQLPHQSIPLDKLASQSAAIGSAVEAARWLYLGPRAQLPQPEQTPPQFIPTANLFQLGLNSPAFVGVDGGLGVSLSALFQDLTDVQCRPALVASCTDVSIPSPAAGPPVVLSVSSGVTPVAKTSATISTAPTLVSCPYAIAPDAGTCTACFSSGDAMGNPTGTFFGIGGPSGDLFLRFPDAVAAPTLPSALADVLGAGLFNTNLLVAGSAPLLSQSMHVCGAVSLDSTQFEFDSASGWIRNIGIYPVMASYDELNGIMAPQNTVANNAIFVTFFIDDIDLENLTAAPGSVPGPLGSLVLSIQVDALMEVDNFPHFYSGCPNALHFSAIPNFTFINWPDGTVSKGINNPVVTVNVLASNGPIATVGTAGLQAIIQNAVSSALGNGIEIDTGGFCVTEAQVLAEPASDGDPTDPVGVANLAESGGIGGGAVALGSVPDAGTPSAYLEIGGFIADAGPGDAGDPPDPPSPLPTLNAMVAEIPPPPASAATGDPPPLPVPAAGQPYEALGITYHSAPGGVFEAAEIGLGDAGLLQGVLFAPVWPVVLGAELIPGVRVPGTINAQTVPDRFGAQAVFSSFEQPLIDAPGLPESLWPIPFGSFQPAAGSEFFPFIGITGVATGAPTSVIGRPEVTALIYSCADAGPDWDRPVGRPGEPLIDGYPVYLSYQGVEIVTPNGFVGGVDAGDPPVVGRPRLSDYLPASVQQAFQGPVAIEAVLPRERGRCFGRRERFDSASRPGRGDSALTDDDGDWGCAEDPPPGRLPPGDPPAAEVVAPLTGYVVVTNAVGEHLGFEPSSGVNAESLLQSLCAGRGVRIEEKASLPLAEFNSCTACGSPPPSTLAEGACWTQRDVVPAILGVKDLLWDARRDPADNHLYPIDGGPQFLGTGVSGFPGDPDGSYVLLPAGADDGDGGFAVSVMLYTEPQQDTLFAVGAADRPLLLDRTGGQFTEQPADVSCVIDAGTFNGVTSSAKSLFLDEPVFPIGSSLLGYGSYMNNPGDWTQVFFDLPTQAEVDLLEGTGPDAGALGSPFEAAPPGLLPFETAIAPGGGDECVFLGAALSVGNQPIYSVNYGLVGDSPSDVPFTLVAQAQSTNGGIVGSSSGCGPTPFARIDAVGYRASHAFPVLAPGVVLQRLSNAQPALDAGSAWWASLGASSAFLMTVAEINQVGFQVGALADGGFGVEVLDGGTSCAPAECTAGSFNDACCIPPGGDALMPLGYASSPFTADQNCCSGTVMLGIAASSNSNDCACQ